MTLRLIAALIACTFGAPLLVTQASFEGKLRIRTIELSVEEDGPQQQLLDVPVATLAQREDADVEVGEMLIRGNVLRIEGGLPGDSGYALWDVARNTMVLVQPKARSFIEFPLDQPPATAPGAPRPGAPTMRSLGQTRTINGMSATGYEVRGPDLLIRAWMTQDHPGLTWAFRRVIAQRDNPGDEEDLATEQLMRYGFPVLMLTLTRGSLRVEETVSVERTTLGAALFQVPAGFTKQTAPR